MRVILTGPESVGKTSLCKALAIHYSAQWVPEYARTYLETLHRHYTYDDVEHIAKVQLQRWNEAEGESMVFFDTFLIITKIWFAEVYGRMPNWIDAAIRNSKVELALLLLPDLPWEADPLRENGSDERRQYLFELYKKELEYYQIPYYIVSGNSDARIEDSIAKINIFLTQIDKTDDRKSNQSPCR